MKLKTLIKVPTNVRIAFSGGVDSLVAAHYYKKLNLNVELWHFNHECEHSDLIEHQCRERANSLGLPIVVGTFSDYGKFEKNQSLEDAWRRGRYNFLRSSEVACVTAHHLDDAVETWIWSALHGNPKLIPMKDDVMYRPFLIIRKDKLYDYAELYDLNPVDDPYNRELDLTRNYMRANMMEHVLRINPGVHKVIKKKYLKEISNRK